MVSGKTIFSIIALELCLSAHLVADEWQGPQIREIFSPDRQYFVRVSPGESWGETLGFKGAKIGSMRMRNSFVNKRTKAIASNAPSSFPIRLHRSRSLSRTMAI
jgi:hypothetical protein